MKLLKKAFLVTGAMAMAAMAANGDGYRMSICASDNTKLCYNGNEVFLNGMNVAWWDFSKDVGETASGTANAIDENSVRKDLKALRAAGGNSIRWWLYTNNAYDPTFDATTHYATKINNQTIENVGLVLDIAEEYGIVVDLCLLSFDMMKESYEETSSWGGRFDFTANKLILEDTLATRAFIDNAVLPLVKAYKDHPALLSWEIFNEPEGMTSTDNFGSGWGTTLVDIKYIQRVINMTADAIHKEAPKNLVSNGSAKTTMTTDVSGTNYYTDVLLLASGNNLYTQGTLDFYQVHYYPQWCTNAASPMHQTYSYWNLDKPLLIGEFPGASWDNSQWTVSSLTDAVYNDNDTRAKTIEEAFLWAFENGYTGAWGWTLKPETANEFYNNATWSLENSAAGLLAVYNKDSSKVKLSDFTATATDQNGWMKVTYSQLTTNLSANLKYVFSKNLGGSSTAYLTVKNDGTGPDGGVWLNIAIVTNGDWEWEQPEDGCWINSGETSVCEFDVSGMDMDNIYAVYIYVGTEDFEGVLYFDDFYTDKGLIIDFNEDLDLFTRDGDEANTYITNIETYYDGESAHTPAAITKANALKQSHFAFENGKLSVTLENSSSLNIDLYNVSGKRIESLHKGKLSKGTHSYALTQNRGVYLVKVRGQGVNYTQRIVIK